MAGKMSEHGAAVTGPGQLSTRGVKCIIHVAAPESEKQVGLALERAINAAELNKCLALAVPSLAPSSITLSLYGHRRLECSLDRTSSFRPGERNQTPIRRPSVTQKCAEKARLFE